MTLQVKVDGDEVAAACKANGDARRFGSWMQTYSGKAFYPLDPRPNEMFIADIAGALSKMCRYGGHCLKFYSVAEHCVLVAEHALPEHKLTALLHDASEAYIVDVPRPIKPDLPNYYAIEEEVMKVVARRFDIIWPMPPEVKSLDNRILGDERDQIMARPPHNWGLTEPPLGVKIECWDPSEAHMRFMQAFYRYGGVG